MFEPGISIYTVCFDIPCPSFVITNYAIVQTTAILIGTPRDVPSLILLTNHLISVTYGVVQSALQDDALYVAASQLRPTNASKNFGQCSSSEKETAYRNMKFKAVTAVTHQTALILYITPIEWTTISEKFMAFI